MHFLRTEVTPFANPSVMPHGGYDFLRRGPVGDSHQMSEGSAWAGLVEAQGANAAWLEYLPQAWMLWERGCMGSFSLPMAIIKTPETMMMAVGAVRGCGGVET